MSITSSELRKLATLNLSPEQMAGVLELLADRVEADENRRAAQAERKRRSRDKSATVTGQERDEDVTPSPLVPPLSPAPLSPPIIPPTRSDLLGGRALEQRLREAAGWQNEPHPNLFVTGCIEELLANGADLERDVLPVIRGRAQKLSKASGWSYFVGPIKDAMRARKEAGTGPPPRPGSAVPDKAPTLQQLMAEIGWTPGTKFASSTG